MLFEMRNNLQVNEKSSELTKWLAFNGYDTVEKFKQLERSDFNRVLTFSGKRKNRRFCCIGLDLDQLTD